MDEKNCGVIETGENGLTLLELFRAIKDNLFLLLVICFGFVVLGVIYTFYFVTPMYTSSVDLKISYADTEVADTAKVQMIATVKKNIVEYIKFRDVILPVLQENGWDDELSLGTVQAGISTSSLGDSAIVRVFYEDSDPKRAVDLVVALAESLAERINEEGNLRIASEHVELINKPLADSLPPQTAPNTTLNIIISFMLGMIAGVVVIILKEQFNNKFSTKREIEFLLQLPVLVLIPEIEEGDIID